MPPHDENVGGSRADGSLGKLTKSFVQLVQQAPNGILDLNNAAAQLDVRKRRIYDITNVLEGIGLIEKKSKNNIQWKGCGDIGSPKDSDRAELKRKYEELQEESDRYDRCIEQLNSDLQKQQSDEFFRQRAFVTDEDIRSIQSFRNQTLIAIKAPRGTTLAVPYPEPNADPEQRKYQIFLKSAHGPVNIYLVSSPHQRESASEAGSAEEDGAESGAEGKEEADPGFLRLTPPPEETGGADGAGFCDFYQAEPST